MHTYTVTESVTASGWIIRDASKPDPTGLGQVLARLADKKTAEELANILNSAGQLAPSPYTLDQARDAARPNGRFKPN